MIDKKKQMGAAYVLNTAKLKYALGAHNII